ncbi:cytidylyltransferase domain-containing protein [Selenomonas sp. FC4001]|uniref:cytidylyltransferase domain-containing protein n=1 Tax=Selenomonas sp. FC4001 TaxID=1408313 RepID=UPI000560D599|nr:glycosyltransferase family protein [Selenomonas sp. FC4001]
MKPKVVAIIEARMTSTRLPGKVLMQGCGKPLLQHMIERLKRSKHLDDVIVATTVNDTDDGVVELCEEIGCSYFRGSEDDVLLRVLNAAKEFSVDVIVETTGDCPFIDWRHIDKLIDIYMTQDYDFVSNATERSFPDGFDIRIFSQKALQEVNDISNDPLDHEHVAIYFPRHPDKYKCFNLKADGEEDRPDLEVTLDEIGDYKLIKAVFDALYPENEDFSCVDVIRYIDAHPDLMKLTKGIKRKGIS